jgi:hypothetical protein
MPIAAMDETTEGGLHAKDPKQVIRKFQHGAKMKYGVSYHEGEVSKTSYQKLPVFIVRTTIDELLLLAKETEERGGLEGGVTILQNILEDLERQAGMMQDRGILDDEELRNAYAEAGEIFRAL